MIKIGSGREREVKGREPGQILRIGDGIDLLKRLCDTPSQFGYAV